MQQPPPQLPPGYAVVQQQPGQAPQQLQPQQVGANQQQYALAVQPPQRPQGAPQSVIPGVTIVQDSSGMIPMFLVIAREKEGKSATVGTSLVNWPRPGMHPLFFAFDESGPNSCLKLGYQPHVMQIKKLPGTRMIDKTRDGLTRLEANAMGLRSTYGSLIVDCGSTMVDLFHEDARKGKNPNPQSHFGDALMWSREVMHRLMGLGMPIWWLAWLREAETVEEKMGNSDVKVKKVIPGGANILGNFRNVLSGKVQHIFILEKKNVGQHPAADEQGFVRIFHTRDHLNIRAGGRFSHLLPPEMPANGAQVMQLVLAAR